MPKKGGPNYRRFAVTVHRLSGESVTVPGCTGRTRVRHVVDEVTKATKHLIQNIGEFDLYLVVGLTVLRYVSHRLTLHQAHIDRGHLVFVVFTEPLPMTEAETWAWGRARTC